MRIKILEKLRRVTDPNIKTVASDLSRLDEVRKGLGAEATEYVLNGRDEMVLSTIGTLCSGNPLEVATSYAQPNSPTMARRRLLVRQEPFDVELAVRYAEVLAASCEALPDSAVGSAKVPKAIRVFFSEAFFGIRKRPNVYPAEVVPLNGKGLTVAHALAVTKALGGTSADFVDVLYQEECHYWTNGGGLYRQVVSVKPFAQSDAEAFIAAGGRIKATARAQLLQDLSEFGLVAQPEYLDFVLERVGDGSKSVRETATSLLSGVPAEQLETKAAASLAKGKVNMRAGMVELLANIGSESALETLRAHREKEKTARVVSLIDSKLTASAHQEDGDQIGDDATGYRAIDGSRVEVPPLRPLDDQGPSSLGAEAKRELARCVDEDNERIRQRNKEAQGDRYYFKAPLFKKSVAADAVAFFEAGGTFHKELGHQVTQLLSFGGGAKWSRRALGKLSQKQALAVAYRVLGSIHWAFSVYGSGPFADYIREWIDGPDGDLRHLEALDIELETGVRFGWGDCRRERPFQQGDFVRMAIEAEYGRLDQLEDLPSEALWPYLAENLEVFDEAFGLHPTSGIKMSRIAAVRLLRHMPKAPARCFAQLLEVATGETKGGRAEARAMLAQAPDVADHIVGLLNDSRQAVRAGAAEWIAERNDEAAVPALKARVEKEKSAIAKAAILTALEALGDDLSGYLGPEALLAEAEKGLEKANFKKLEWMALDHLPRVHYRSGEAVPAEVLRWWIFLAVKLKQPGGNALFDMYLEQLAPDDAEALSTWVLDSWVNYDTAKPAEEEANAYARLHAKSRYKTMTLYIPDYTEERAFADLKLGYMSEYPNSGAATKGLLALAKRASAVLAAERTRAYLKNHGLRTSQSSSLLEMLAASGDPVGLQVVISAATRLKQKGVQKFAGQLVEKVAEARNWSMDELADRTIPAAGLDDDGVLRLACAEDKVYEARLGDKCTLVLHNPAGKVVKSLPSGTDDAKAAKKQLSASRRELKQIVLMQSARLYEALCAERVWTREDWQRDLHGHPVMRRLLERVIWFGLDGEGNVCGTFRPTAEGDFTDAHDESVDVESFEGVRLAYGAVMSTEDAEAWERHLDDYEVTPLFVQVGRTLLKVDDAAAQKVEIEDRKGWVTDTFTIRGGASKLGYERGEAMDGGYFNEYTKGFRSAGLVAVIEFSGNCLPEENVPAALISLSFEKYAAGRRMGHPVKLGEVPPVLLSECWNDYRAMAGKAAFDEGWRKKMPWM